MVNAKTYINSGKEFATTYKRVHYMVWDPLEVGVAPAVCSFGNLGGMRYSGKNDIKKIFYNKIFHIETPWIPLCCNYCYFQGNNISPLVLLLPLFARWCWTRAPAVGRMSVGRLPASQLVSVYFKVSALC